LKGNSIAQESRVGELLSRPRMTDGFRRFGRGCAAIPPLCGLTRQDAARKRKPGRSGRNDNFWGKGYRRRAASVRWNKWDKWGVKLLPVGETLSFRCGLRLVLRGAGLELGVAARDFLYVLHCFGVGRHAAAELLDPLGPSVVGSESER